MHVVGEAEGQRIRREREVRGEVEPRGEAAREHFTERKAVHVLARHGERQGQGVGQRCRERKGEAGQVDRTAPTTTTTTLPPSTGSTTTTTTTTTTTAPAPVIALGVSLDPTFTQNPSNPFEVTYTFNASATVDGQPAAPGQLPSGVLDFFNDGLLASSLNVGGSVTGGTVTITYGAFGTHSVVTEYVSGTNSATTGAQPEDIEPPPVAPTTVTEVWGATAPTNGASATVHVIGSSASVSISDANFEGATSVGVTDQLGDSCTATVSGTAATCTMSVTGTPSSLTVNYPGGTSVVTTQTVSPWGVPQSQQVTDTWPSESVPISGSHLAVTVQAATVVWNGGSVLNGSVSARTWSGDPANPINITSGQSVRLGAYASGSLGSDTIGLGGIGYTVSPSGSYSLTDEQPSSSVNCSDSSDYVGDAVGYCQITFTETGTFTIPRQAMSRLIPTTRAFKVRA